MSKKIYTYLIILIGIILFPSNLFSVSDVVFRIMKYIIAILLFIYLYFSSNKRVRVKTLTKKIHTLGPIIIFIVAYLFLSLNPELIYWNKSLILPVTITFLGVCLEEIAFRLFFLTEIITNTNNLKRGVVLSSLLFSFIHITNLIKSGDFLGSFNQLIFAFFMGILLSCLALLLNSLKVAIVVHFLINLPSTIKKTIGPESADIIDNNSLIDNVLSILMFLLIMSPLFILAYFYYDRIKSVDFKIVSIK